LTEEAYLSCEHVNVLVQGDVLGLIDEALARRGKSRKIAVTVAHFGTALTILRGTDLIYTGPASLFQNAAMSGSVRTFVPPVSLPPFPTQMAWSRRSDQDQGLRWVRSCVSATAGTLTIQSAAFPPKP
jgi:DNA-binding transcriptional LysR family regulator